MIKSKSHLRVMEMSPVSSATLTVLPLLTTGVSGKVTSANTRPETIIIIIITLIMIITSECSGVDCGQGHGFMADIMSGSGQVGNVNITRTCKHIFNLIMVYTFTTEGFYYTHSINTCITSRYVLHNLWSQPEKLTRYASSQFLWSFCVTGAARLPLLQFRTGRLQLWFIASYPILTISCFQDARIHERSFITGLRRIAELSENLLWPRTTEPFLLIRFKPVWKNCN